MSATSESPRFDVVVVGSINVDFAARGPSIPRPGETCSATELAEGFGGKGANQAVAAAKLGARVAMVGCVGDDARGEGARKNLAAHGVDVTGVGVARDTPTGVAVIHVGRSGEKSIMVFSGANGALTKAAIESAAALVAPMRVVVAELEIPDEAVAAAARLAKRCGARFVLDPAPARPLSDDLLALTDLLKPNAREAETLTGIAVIDRASAVRAARALLDRGARAVSVASPEGNHLVTQAGEASFARHDVRSVDATGAGDAFVGALASRLAEGATLDEAVQLANAAAALKTTRLGAQSLPTRAEIDALLGARRRQGDVRV